MGRAGSARHFLPLPVSFWNAQKCVIKYLICHCEGLLFQLEAVSRIACSTKQNICGILIIRIHVKYNFRIDL